VVRVTGGAVNPRRQLLAGVAVLVVTQCLVWVVAGSIWWSFRGLMAGGPASPHGADDAHFAIAVFIAAAVNGAALVPFLLLRRRWSVILLIVIQALDALVALPLTLLISVWWILITIVAAPTIALLFIVGWSMRASISS
jgi:hypothetical protein